MTTRAVIPTEHELGILTADKPLLAILRPMDVQPPEGTISFRYDEHFGWIGHDLLGPVFLVDIKEIPYAPGDVMAWQEEWCLDHFSPHIDEVGIHFPANVHRHFKVSHETAVTILCASGKGFQPATTMPESIARFRNTVAECRPVQVAKLDWQAISRLGLESLDNEWHSNFRERFCIRWPDIPLDSWAWWIGLDPKGNQ